MNAPRACLVIDSHPVVRLGIRSLLDPDYETEGVRSGREALELLTSVGHFDVAVVEMRNPGDGAASGTATIRDLLGAQPALGIVALGVPLERYAVRAALDAGAAAYVSKRSPPVALRSAVDAASEQQAFVDPDAAGPTRAGGLTRRQSEVMQLYANGLSTEQIAQRLALSEETVRTHAKAGIARIGARDRTHAVAIAMRGSLID